MNKPHFPAEITCETPEFSLLCAALKVAGLEETLAGGTYTVFAPTDSAFVTLFGFMGLDPESDPGAVLASYDAASLQSLLLYHTIEGVALDTEGLICGATAVMTNEDTTEMYVNLKEDAQSKQPRCFWTSVQFPFGCVSDLRCCFALFSLTEDSQCEEGGFPLYIVGGGNPCTFNVDLVSGCKQLSFLLVAFG